LSTAKHPRRKAGRTRSGHKQTSRPANKRWSAQAAKHSDALDLESGVFTRTPRQIASSLKRSAERSRRRKGTPFQSAMSMLNFYINRAGKSLTAAKRHKLERAKDELRDLFGRA
jgi:hypothetical protein